MLGNQSRRFFCGFACALVLCFGAGVKAVQADEAVYRVTDVRIEETAGSEAQAKAQGLAKGKRKAFQRLLGKLIPRDRMPGLQSVEFSTIDRMIYGVSLSDEKMSRGQGRYLARMDVRFQPEAIRGWLRRRGIPYAETPGQKLVVLPLLRQAGTIQLWEESNNWFQAWARLEMPVGLVPIALPWGDVSDLGVITAREAYLRDESAFQAIAEKYDARGVMLATLTVESLPEGAGQRYTAEADVFATGWEGFAWRSGWNVTDDSPGVSKQQQAARQAVDALQEYWKRQNLLDYSQGRNKLVINAPLNGLDDWINLQAELQRMAAVDRYVVESLTIRNAVLALDYLGSVDRLKSALAQKNLMLNYVAEDDSWVLMRGAQ